MRRDARRSSHRSAQACVALAALLLLAHRAHAEPLDAPEQPAAASIAGPSDRLPIRRPGEEASGVEGQQAVQPAAGSSFDLPRLIIAMSIVIGLIFLLKWLAGRAMPGSRPGASGPVRLLGRTVIGPRQQVLTFGIGRRVVVTLESHGQSTTLTEITDADEVAELIGRLEGRSLVDTTDEPLDVPTPRRFGNLFSRSTREFEQPGDSFPTERDEPTQVPAEMTNDVRELLSRIRGLGQSLSSSKPGSGRAGPGS